ncbi:ras guanine nucleotide exchange factor domain-containing protein, partial [Cladochytrium replicatum]
MEMAANTTILLFRPLTISLQLCLIEHSLFCKIEPAHLLVHKPPQHPSPSIHASTEFFNYLTRLVETSILEPLVPNIRGMVIHTWVKVAWCLLQLRNYQTLKGVVSALGTPPIARLKRTWQCVSKKTMATLKQLKDLVSEQNNYSQYRELMKKNVTRPSVPFLGVVIHDLTYLMALAKKENIGDPTADKRVKEILDQIDYYRKGPRYNLAMLADLELREPPSSVSVNTTASATTSNSPMPGQVSTSSAGSSGKNSRTFRSGEKKMKYGMVQKMLDEYQMVKEFDDESLGAFCAHWILSRRWYTEKEIDEISLLREP